MARRRPRAPRPRDLQGLAHGRQRQGHELRARAVRGGRRLRRGGREADARDGDDGRRSASSSRAPAASERGSEPGSPRPQILAPRTGRLLTAVLAAGAVNDFLLAGFSALTAKANELEQRTAGLTAPDTSPARPRTARVASPRAAIRQRERGKIAARSQIVGPDAVGGARHDPRRAPELGGGQMILAPAGMCPCRNQMIRSPFAASQSPRRRRPAR